MDYKMHEHDERMFKDLRKYNLRHPGVISKKVTKLLGRDTFDFHQICAARLEWRQLGLDTPAQPSPGGTR